MAAPRWSNWSGLVQFQPETLAQPNSIEELRNIVSQAAEAQRTVRTAGSGHSFTELVKTEHTLVSLDHLQGLIEVHPETHEATVHAGTKLWLLNALLDEHGLAMENLGDINRQSISGAVSTGTHGTGADFGVISTQATAFTIVTATGELLECSETRNSEIFKAAQVSLGALGVLASIRLRLVPAYRLHYVRKRSTLEETAENLARYCSENRQFEFYYFPYTDTVQQKFLNLSEAPADTKPLRKWFSDVVMENLSFGAMSRMARAKPSLAPAISRFAARFVTESEETNTGHKVLSTARYVRFNEMEYAVPAERGMDCLTEIKDWIITNDIEVHFPIEFRFIKADDIYLSPGYGRDTVAISVHMYKGMEFRRYFAGCEGIFRKHQGRPHWGKLHSLTAAELSPLYPRWENFQEIRRQLDPNGVFLTPYLKMLLEV